MPIQWPTERPADFRIVDVGPEPAGDGRRSQLLLVIEYLGADGKPFGDRPRRKLTLNPGEVRRWLEQGYLAEPKEYDPAKNLDDEAPAGDERGLPYHEVKFREAYDVARDALASVLSQFKARIPDQVVVDLWEKH